MSYNWANVASDNVAAMSSTNNYLQAPPWASAFHIRTQDDGASAGADVDWKFLERVQSVQHYDLSALSYTEYADELRDKFETTRVATLNDMATGDFLYVGFDRPVRGIYVDVGNPDGGAGVMAVTYWNGSSWANITPTDNTSMFGTDGTVTWTVPSDWERTKVNTTSGLFWIRIATSVALDASCDLRALVGLHKESISTAGARVQGGTSQDGAEPVHNFDRSHVGGIELQQVGSQIPAVTITWFGR